MPRRTRPKPKRDPGVVYRSWRTSVRVGGELVGPPSEGPVTILEEGTFRGYVMAERAALLAEHFRAISKAFAEPGLDAKRRHALADEVDGAWWGLARSPSDSLTRIAMEFLEALRVACERRDRFLRLRAVSLRMHGYDLGAVDAAALRSMSAEQIESAADMLRRSESWHADLASFHAHWAPEEAQRLLSVVHPHSAARVPSDDWWAAIEAWDRGPRSKRRRAGALPKWQALTDILRRNGLWSAKWQQLKEQWLQWNREGSRTPLFLRGDRSQGQLHEARSNRPAVPSAGAEPAREERPQAKRRATRRE